MQRATHDLPEALRPEGLMVFTGNSVPRLAASVA